MDTRLMRQAKNFINEKIKKLQITLSNRSIDSEYYLALGYLFTPIFAIFVTLIGMLTIVPIGYDYPKLLIILLVVLVMINGYFLYFFGKKCWKYFRMTRFMLGCISLVTVYLFFLQTLVWIYFLTTYISNFLLVFISLRQNNTLNNPMYLLMILVNKTYPNIKDSISGISPIVGVFFVLNQILPKSLQTIELTFPKRILRLIIKVGFIVLIVCSLYVFSCVNKDNWLIVSGVYGFIMSIKPEKILTLIHPKKTFKSVDVSESIRKSFFMYRVFLTGIYLSWMISIYIYPSSVDKRLFLFLVMCLSYMVILIVIQIYGNTSGKNYFEKWLKKD